MKFRNGVLVLAAGLRWIGLATADHAVAAIEILGGRVVRDERKPGKPVVEVSIRGNEVTVRY